MSTELDRPCRVCGRNDWVRSGTTHDPATRFDAETCDDRCRKLRERGHDLAYLGDWPPALAQARRAIHQAISDRIEIERMIRQQRRVSRKAAKVLKERRATYLKANPDPAPEEPAKRRGGNFITV